MWKQKTKEGSYRYFDRDHNGKLVSFTSKKRLSDRQAAAILDKKVEESSINMSDLRLNDLVRLRIEWLNENYKVQSALSARNHLLPMVELIGNVRLEKLNARLIKDKLPSDKPATYNEYLKHFKAMMRWAYREEYMSNVSFIDKIPRMKDKPVREKDKYKYLERSEIKILLNGMKVEQWKLMSEFMILSGLRVGEAIALLKSDIGEDTITVSKTYSLITHEISSTKTDASFREVHIQPELQNCIDRIIETSYQVESPLFFHDINGTYINYNTFNKYVRENTEALIGRRLTTHAFRHTHVAMLAEAGLPLEVISRRVGHADSSVTRDIYMHVTENMKKRDNDRLDGVNIL